MARSKKQKKKFQKNHPKVSVIICAKNEMENLQENLPHIVHQNYPNDFEIVLVNDASTDKTLNVIESFAAKFPYINIVNITGGNRKNLKGKKNALQAGISAAKYNYLILTDADCKPNSNNWLRLIANNYTNSIQLILGYGPYEYRRGLLNKCIQYETLMTACQYCSHFEWGIPYMGTGRNLSYTKEIFLKNEGFKNINQVKSGDDDLLVSKIANKKNTCLELHPDSFCYSKPPEKWKDWYHQKLRHISTSFHYKPIHQFTLGIYAFSHFFVYVGFIFLAFQNFGLVFALCLLAVRLLIQIVIFHNLKKLFDSPLTVTQLLLIDILFVIYYVIFSISINLHKSVLWK